MKGSLTYSKAGVHVTTADRFVEELARLARRTHQKGIIAGVGGFAGLFRDARSRSGLVWAASSDGVGTKILLAARPKELEAIGIDLVAMNVNDCLAVGAEPLIFLDYFATSRLRIPQAIAIMRGICRGLKEARCTLLGGETAEMPGLYRPGHFDLAGFCVGVVRPETRLQGPPREGDCLIGLASTGVHSNGFSLVRRLWGKSLTPSLKDELLKPTAIYVRPVLAAMRRHTVRAVVHVTGSGWQGNIPRVLPDRLAALITLGSWPVKPIFAKIERRARLSKQAMFSTFNMGIGMILVVPPREAGAVVRFMRLRNVRAWDVGRIVRRKQREPQVQFIE